MQKIKPEQTLFIHQAFLADGGNRTSKRLDARSLEPPESSNATRALAFDFFGFAEGEGIPDAQARRRHNGCAPAESHPTQKNK